MEPGEMIQQLTTLATLDSKYLYGGSAVSNSSFRGPDTLSWSPCTPGMYKHAQTYMNAKYLDT